MAIKSQLLPSIFAADVGNMNKEIEKMNVANIELIHYDVMDNHFVPNISFGSLFIQQMMKATPNIKADIHLMIELSPLWEEYLKLMPYSLTIHMEAGSEELVKSILKKIRSKGVLAGLSIKPATPISAIQNFVDDIDLLLIMSVEPGFSYQSFIPESIQKIQEARELLGDNIIIEADGGISSQNMKELKKAGLDWFVMGGGFFKEENVQQLITEFDSLSSF